MKKLAILALCAMLSITSTSQTYNMTNASIQTCSGTFYDDGGAAGNYGKNDLYIETFDAGAANKRMVFNFTAFNTDLAATLYVFNGPNVFSPAIATISGNWGAYGVVSSTQRYITFMFVSDNHPTKAGWAAAISCGSSLPIELLCFSSKCDGDKVNVEWSTGSEYNNDYFLVQSSIDALEWRNVGKINGQGNTLSWTDYAYTDYYPSQGTSYYRLVQYDFDGACEEFSPVSVTCDAKASSISIMPNPFDNMIIVKSVNMAGCKMVICAYGINGEEIMYTEYDVNQYVQVWSINMEFIEPGGYVITAECGNVSKSFKMIKK